MSIEIKSTGEVIINHDVIAKIIFLKPWADRDLVGEYFTDDDWDDGYFCGSCDEMADDIRDLEHERDELVKALQAMIDAKSPRTYKAAKSIAIKTLEETGNARPDRK